MTWAFYLNTKTENDFTHIRPSSTSNTIRSIHNRSKNPITNSKSVSSYIFNIKMVNSRLQNNEKSIEVARQNERCMWRHQIRIFDVRPPSSFC